MARARCSDACPPAATLVSLAALFMNLQLAHPNPPSTFPTHVDWCMDASMSGSQVPTHTETTPRDTPHHACSTRRPHQPCWMVLAFSRCPSKGLSHLKPYEQDNCINWKHMRYTRNHKRQHEPNETPRHSAAHTHLRGNSSAQGTILGNPRHNPWVSKF